MLLRRMSMTQREKKLVPEPRSALASVTSGAIELAAGLSCRELAFADLVMASAWPETEKKVFGTIAGALGMTIPGGYRTAATASGKTVFRIAPRRLMLVTESEPLEGTLSMVVDAADAAIIALDHSRVRIRLEGIGARALLTRGMAVNLDDDVFQHGDFAQTNIHHMWVLVHRVAAKSDGEAFDIYILRSFALSFWHWLTNTAHIATQTAAGKKSLAR